MIEIDQGAASAQLPRIVQDILQRAANHALLADSMVSRFAEFTTMSADLDASRRECGRLAMDLSVAVEENRGLNEELALTKSRLAAASEENLRMVEGFNDLLRAVMEANGTIVGIDRRIEAALLSADVGVGSSQPSDITPQSARAFIAEMAAVPAPAIR